MYNLKSIYDDPNKFSDLLFKPGYLIYRIYNSITNKSYIGDTETNLYNRLFTGWYGGHFGRYESGYKAHLYNSMRKYGLDPFYIELLDWSDELNEEYYIAKYDSYHNGYNQNKSGKGTGDCNSGMIWINDGNSSKMIYPEELDKYLKNGYSKGRLTEWLYGLIWIHLNDERLRVPEDELEYYLSKGYELGTGISPIGSTGKVWVNNGECEWMIDSESPLCEGVNYGRINDSTGGLFCITNGRENRFVTEEMFKQFSSDWYIGTSNHSNSGMIYINDGESNYMIYPDELDKYLKEGYSKGRLSSSTKGRYWVSNKEGELHVIKEEEWEYYKSLGYKWGRNYETAWDM